ncbi:uncharacterized protein LOC142625014 [Castanea sativa]|uniref:uncharacterized protein LOC142625014 n=1 Tax=Castanea sativa TaxID=21020 RepID=UPI003F64C969
MYLDLFNGLNLKVEDLEKYGSPLVGFDGKSVILQGMIRLPVYVEDEEVQVNFIVVRAYSPYIAILARPWLHAMGAVSSTLHVKVKYPIRGRQLKKPAWGLGVDLDGDSAEELYRVFIGEDKERYFQVGSQLPALEKVELVKLLKANIDVFSWMTYDVPGIDPEFICHHLNVSPEVVPRKHPLRCASQEHAEAIKEEVNKLKQAGAIKETFYPEWLANTVVVKKKNGKWRVCVDFTDLNRVCPKDPFPIPRIDQLVDATVGHPRMSFLDAFQGYHLIPLSLADQEKIAFRAPNGNYHYRVMPFGKFLGYMITHRGIEVNPDQIRAIRGLHPPQNPKEVQRLTAIKGQVLANFVAEFMEGSIKQEEVILTVMSIGSVKSLRLGFVATNNEAEYEALLAGAQMVKHLGGEVVEFYCDSRLIVGQVNGEFEAIRDERQKYLNRVKCALSMFKQFKVRQIPRGQNAHVDSLAMLATSLGSKLPRTVMVEDLMNSSLASISAIGIHSIQVGPSWMDPIITFLKHGLLPEDKVEAEKFDSKSFRWYYGRLGIRNGYSTPAYPQGNGQAEATNKVILAGLKKRLDDAKGRWVEEIPHVLWTFRTTPRRSTGETPFSMTYGIEVVIPLELGFPTLKSEQYSDEGNQHMLLDNLDTIEERREVASVKMGSYQQKLKQTYDKGVRPRPLVPGDLVLRKVVGTAKNPVWGKLRPNWEGLYRITSVAGIGAYYLEDLDEKAVRRPWNADKIF